LTTDAPKRFSIPEITPASLRRSPFLSEQSAWNEHIPFAGWVVEAVRPRVIVELGTHVGVSYFAFSESVLQLKLDSKCHAVDTWKGDDHAGFYGEEVFRGVTQTNNARYSAFSTLHRTRFDEAAPTFPAESIDLLHIDGFHTYEAARHDFDTWLPKLSKRGVVLLHDANEHKKGFGVYRLLNELRTKYPVFEFLHGHGLGVVYIGNDAPKALNELTAIDGKVEGDTTRRVFSQLGRRLPSELELRQKDLTISSLEKSLATAGQAAEQQLRALADLDAEVSVKSSEIESQALRHADTQARLQSLRADTAKTELALMRVKGDLTRTKRLLSRLQNRRPIRLALRVSSAARPLFRLVRRLRRGRQKEPSS
jgi:hypothetical protein